MIHGHTRFLSLALLVSLLLARPVPAAPALSLDRAFQTAASYQPDKDRKSLERIKQAVREAANDADRQAAIEQRLIGLLESPDATTHARLFACKQLYLVGSARCVPTLAAMLRDPKTVDMACYALRSNPSREAGEALLAAVKSAPDAIKPTLIHTLGQRGDSQAVATLIGLVDSPRPAIACAAMRALGRDADDRVVTALKNAMRSRNQTIRRTAEQTLLACAAACAAKGQADRATEINRQLLTADQPMYLRRGALLGLMRYGKAEGVAAALAVLKTGPAELKSAVAAHAGWLDGEHVIDTLMATLDQLDATQQATLVTALVDRHGQTMLPYVKKLADHSTPSVRVAALTALGRLGDSGSVDRLLGAIEGTPAEKNAALTALIALPRGSLEKGFADRMAHASKAVQLELVNVLAARKDIDDLARLIDSPDDDIAVAALRVYGLLAETERLDALFHVQLHRVKNERRRKSVEQAIVMISRHHHVETSSVQTVVALWNQTRDAAMRGSLLRIAGALPNDQSLSLLTDALHGTDATCRDTALRQLVDWPDPKALAVLAEVVRGSADATHRVLALRGLVGLASRTGVPAEQQMESLELAWQHADAPAQRKLVLGGLAKVPSAKAFALVLPGLNDTAVQTEACLAAIGISDAIINRNPQAVFGAMHRVVEVAAKNPSVQNRAKKLLDRAEQAMFKKLGYRPAGPWRPLFNGKDTTGWTKTGHGEFFVENGCLVGTQTDGLGGDLWTTSRWSDFELRTTYRIKWPANSGIWYRWNGKKGYQFDILKYKRPIAFSGSLYCPGKMFIIRNTDESLENRDGWNESRILAAGPHLTQWLNGVMTGSVKDDLLSSGAVGIQVHPSNPFKGMRMIVRQMEIRPLKKQ